MTTTLPLATNGISLMVQAPAITVSSEGRVVDEVGLSGHPKRSFEVSVIDLTP